MLSLALADPKKVDINKGNLLYGIVMQAGWDAMQKTMQTNLVQQILETKEDAPTVSKEEPAENPASPAQANPVVPKENPPAPTEKPKTYRML